MRRRSTFRLFPLIPMLLLAMPMAAPVSAQPFYVDAAGFEIDENLAFDSLDDWQSAIDNFGSGEPISPFFGPGVISDEIFSIGGLSDSTHFKGGNKFLDPASWVVISKNGGSAQTDLGNAYIVAHDEVLYVGFERFKEEGDFHLDVEVNKAQPVAGAPQRVAGDIAAIVDILKNPVDGSDLRVRLIQFTSPTSFIVLRDIDQTGATDLQTEWDTQGIVVVMNGAPFNGSFNHTVLDGNQNWDATKYVEDFTFVEMAIDLAAVGIQPSCPGFAAVHLKSRASDAVNSDLKDLVGPRPLDLSTCGSKTFNLDFGSQNPIDDLRYYVVVEGHDLDSPDTDGGLAGDLNLQTGDYELTAGNGYSVDFGTVAPGTLHYRYEARAADGSTVVLATPSNSETIGSKEDVTNDATFSYSLTIDGPQTNEVGNAETFTATLTGELCDDSGDSPACDDGALPGVSVSHEVTFSVDDTDTSVTPSPQDTDGSGQVQITVNSPIAQVATITAKVASAAAADSAASDTTSKTWVDARILISPLMDTNGITEQHTLTATVEQDDGVDGGGEGGGSGFTSAPDGTAVSFSLLNNTAGAVFVGANTCSTVGGSCSIAINSDAVGSVEIQATTTFSVGGVSLTRTTGTGGNNSSNAHKNYVAGSLRWYKVDANGSPLGGATFQVCRTHDRFGTDITDECTSVLDNQAPDMDADPGEFYLTNLKLGRYTVAETVPPPGFKGDGTVATVEIGQGDPPGELDIVISDPWVNTVAGRITPTGTECIDYLSGTAGDLTEVTYRTKDGLINSIAPGVFFYYTSFEAAAPDFDLLISQTNSFDPAYDFPPQNLSNVRLFNGDCSIPSVSWSVLISGGQVTISIQGASAGDTFIASVKYEPNYITGLTGPTSTTVHYDYRTYLNAVLPENLVDLDSDGVDLVKKGGN